MLRAGEVGPVMIPVTGEPAEGRSMVIGRTRWALAVGVGTILYLAVVFGSQVGAAVFLPGELEGIDYAWIGLVQLGLGLPVVSAALRIAGLTLRDVGLTTRGWPREAMIGTAVASAFAILQFGLVIPLTGGAERSDVVANKAQIGDAWFGVIGFIALAWTGAAMEEVFFRGHFLNTLRGLIGPGRGALIIAAAATVLLFAVLHSYQGWAGIVDAGIYGGLTLTLLYLWRGTLTACIIAHALWNTSAALALFLLY